MVAYTPTNWQDRISQNPGQFPVTGSVPGNVTLTLNDNPTQAGTQFTAALMNVTQFDYVSGLATITITYLVNTVNEPCNLSIDGQSVPVNIVNGVGSFTFTSQVTGWHRLTASSSSYYGRNIVSVEVV